MADEDLGPEYLTTRGIPTSRRGYDKRVVDAVVGEARQHWQALLDRYEELKSAVEEAGGLEFLGRELSVLGTEVGEILAAAQSAADGMRRRTREETERIQREAEESAQGAIEEAEQQARDLRSDAWEEGTELLAAASAEAERIVRVAKEDALLIRAQSEKDAHRYITGAEQEANDLIRQARYQADRQLNQARELAQQIIDRASTPQYEGEPAVPDADTEARRDELIDEIERIRLEQSIDSVEVFGDQDRHVAEPPPRPQADPDGIDLSDVLAAEVEEMRGEPIGVPREADVAVLPSGGDFRNEDDVGTLFDALRVTGETEPVRVEEQLPTDPFELRDQLLIPVINEGVRETKRRIVDLQNDALAGIRGEGWDPNPSGIARELGLGLESIILKSASGGASAAGPLAGLRGATAAPGDRPAQLVVSMAAALSGQLAAGLEDAKGPEQAAEAASRVFRSWRADDAEQWVRMVATAAYHDSLLAALREGGIDEVQGVAGSSTCEHCPGPNGLTWRPGREPPVDTRVPPANSTCRCTVVVAS